MSTKAQQVLNPHSDWNQAGNDEPVFVLRARNWKAALVLVAITKTEGHTTDELLKAALAMREWSRDNEIPF